ncbi:hypothetical protein [Mesorhizobium sp. B2-2-1]|uniref:hypothetical protein n=1 Tax=Mesorhizobium sp. B2-2-1 TaxID=2589965 RepID=UPI00112CBF7A|nr:hypothetical protein [Mesorhizobium sp. B2-2-1]TPM67435.1 hypothetical protein FJ965_09870 [Mesorhizobium sp. B2-2-1]
MDLQSHNLASAKLRDAANLANGIADNLTKLNAGAQPSEVSHLAGQVDMWFLQIGKTLGYSVVKNVVAA